MRKLLSLIAIAAIFASLFVSCKNNGWTSAQTNEFISSCTQSAVGQGMGQEQAKSYCSCMAQKLAVKFPNAADTKKITNETMQTPEMVAMVQGCLGGNVNNNNTNNPPNPFGNINGNNNNNNNNNRMGGAWTKEDEDKWMNTCAQGGSQRDLCFCVLQKLEKKYANYQEADRMGSQEEGRQMAQECINNGNGNVNNNNIDNNNNNRMGGGWTQMQHQQFVQSCAGSAQQQQGMTLQEANAYCECMTNKLEQKFTFDQASHLTAADFQTPEWQQAKMDCGAKR